MKQSCYVTLCIPDFEAQVADAFGPVPADRLPDLLRAAVQDLESAARGYSPAVAPFDGESITLDLSGTARWYGPRFDGLALEIRDVIRKTLGLRHVAAGMAGTAFAAGLCAGAACPDGVSLCPPGREAEHLAPFPALLLPGLSKSVHAKLENYNLKTIGDVQALPAHFLESRMGEEGRLLYAMARGTAFEPVIRERGPDAVADLSFARDTNDTDEIRRGLRYAADTLAFKLRAADREAGRLTLSLFFSDGPALRRAHAFAARTADFTRFLLCAQALFAALYVRRVSLRRICLKAGKLARPSGQLDLFESACDRKNRAAGIAIQRIRERMGFNTVLNANVLGANHG